MNEKKILKMNEKWEKEKKILLAKKKIKEEKNGLKNRKFSTTKLLILFLFLNCTAIEIFTGWATIQSINNAINYGLSVDFSPLIALIGAIVGEVTSFLIYSIKATKENTIGGITYLTASQSFNKDEDVKG